MKKQFLKVLMVIFLFGMVASFCNAQTSNSPSGIGRQVFEALKILNSSGDRLSGLFLIRQDGNMLYRELITKAAQRGLSDWSKIEYMNYIHKEFRRDGTNYSSGYLAVKFNGTSDYTSFGIYLLNIQAGNGYKILICNDKWSRNPVSSIPWDDIRENLDDLEEWLD
jgi:hypothetical protein